MRTVTREDDKNEFNGGIVFRIVSIPLKEHVGLILFVKDAIYSVFC